ncbi:hypothetical protein Egran_01280 [Elaphomyces granulatus]|uniref:Alpha-ketoglutarate-dependent dioxygenase AlkB-like domain-containing protein n=1 Tax=Elaphomyces granulatus TaxID=519963 RepID=A0A232M3J7_9EURO|nr:hypothetical protein Egran_01280 [Elaphomyces granulatus]
MGKRKAPPAVSQGPRKRVGKWFFQFPRGRLVVEAEKKKEDPPKLPPVCGEPPAWAETRTELSDAIPWFRMVQGGMHQLDKVLLGALIDSDSGPRAFMDDEIVLTTLWVIVPPSELEIANDQSGGGKQKEDGKWELTKGHGESAKGIPAARTSMATKTAVGIVIGDQNTILRRKLPHRFNILAYFRVSYIWFEKYNGTTFGRIRYDKVDLAEKSWWAAEGSGEPVPLDRRRNGRPESRQCSTCHQLSFRVYDQGWMCLQSTCRRFWKIGESDPPLDLTYNSAFLRFREDPDESLLPYSSLVPDLLSTFPNDISDYHFSPITLKGIVCPLCRKCVSRKWWNGWWCTDPSDSTASSCRFNKRLDMPPVSLRSVVPDLEIGAIKRAVGPNPKPPHQIPPDVQFSRAYLKLTYHIERVGSVTHFMANRDTLGRPNGPNDLFAQLQAANLGLRRNRLRTMAEGTLTKHFATNYGVPYKFTVDMPSNYNIRFSEAPLAVMHALGRLTWAARTVAGEDTLPNELLLVGYFETMSMGYHDDGESGLGPTVTTLSLGGRATMKVRMKREYYLGFHKSRDDLVKDDPVLVGCCKYEERIALKGEFDNRSITKEQYDQRRTEIFKTVIKPGQVKPLIEMRLQHGDFVVMHGANLQKYYEHSVETSDKLRYALTARYIKPKNEAERRAGEFQLTSDMEYNGE